MNTTEFCASVLLQLRMSRSGRLYRDPKTASTVPRAAFRRRNHPFCVRWCLRSSLTYRDLEEIMAERNLSVDHVTIWRWVHVMRRF